MLKDSLGAGASEQQGAYTKYVYCNREREEQELIEKVKKGVIGGDEFWERIKKRVINIRRRKIGRSRK